MSRAFANNLLRQREALGLSAEDFALSINVPADEYAAWERGDAMPPLDVAGRIAGKCGVTIDELMQGEPYQPKLRFGGEDTETESEKAREWAAYEEAAERRYVRGRRIVKAIIIIEAIAMVPVVFVSNIFGTIFSILTLVFLWRGKTWARYVYAILSAIAALSNIARILLISGSALADVILLVLIAYQITTGILICFSRDVEEFLSEQQSIY
ncbi:MAG: helix-turn-helix transcriptional regulator [Clostridia bacterium]|nr:helix-turn-helix transcriptional regulator [Clostridia bacterium]